MNAPMNPSVASRTGSCSCNGSRSQPGSGGCGCSDCLGADCRVSTAVRPRFFAGQLLVEDDLRSLEDYVVTKNRLHNRHLFGDGVVCGLAVLCHPCGKGHVIVEPGYALDCCGNDIVLNCRLELDINAMVRELRQNRLGGYDCGDPCQQTSVQKNGEVTTNQPGATGVTREYCLYVRYCEQESDPVSPYSPDQPCGIEACEMSRIREGLRFELRCRQDAPPPDDFLAALGACFADIVGKERMTQDALTLAGLNKYLAHWRASVRAGTELARDLRDRLLAIVESSACLVSCNLRERLLAVNIPAAPATPQNASDHDPASVTDPAQDAAKAALVAIFVDVLRDCICSALLPRCHDCNDTGVELACLKVRDCEVIDICNLSRRFVLSPVAMRYWLGMGRLEQSWAQLCCADNSCAKTITPPPQEAQKRGAADNRRHETPPVAREEIVLPDIGASARLVQAAVRAVESMLPPKSPALASLGRIEKAFGILAGEHEREPAEPPPDQHEDAGAALADTAKRIKKAADTKPELPTTKKPGDKHG